MVFFTPPGYAAVFGGVRDYVLGLLDRIGYQVILEFELPA
jgi:hypothetical protein